jgi:REP element-mobilizing transposase RayT
MPRKVRLEYEGAVYHVMSRGNKRGLIFENDEDRKVFLVTLGEACERSGAVVYSYVLMGNHYHLLLGTPKGNLVATMQWLQSTYTARFNARHRQCGHVFAGRYKAIPIQEDDPAYCRIVSDYIHLNPARAQLVFREGKPKLKDYAWSSFPGLCGFAKLPGWVDGKSVLGWHHWEMRRKSDRSAYWKYLESRAVEGEEKEDLKVLRRGWFLGGEEFLDRLKGVVKGALGEKKRESFDGEAVSRHDEIEAEKLLKAGMRALGMAGIKEVKTLRKNDKRKQALVWLVKSRTVVGHEWILERLEMGHRSNVTRAMAGFRKGGDRETRVLKAKMIKCSD